MRPKICAILLSLTACSSVHHKPPPDFCVIDYKALEAVCPQGRIDLSRLHKNICFQPKGYEEWMNYINYLEIEAQSCR